MDLNQTWYKYYHDVIMWAEAYRSTSVSSLFVLLTITLGDIFTVKTFEWDSMWVADQVCIADASTARSWNCILCALNFFFFFFNRCQRRITGEKGYTKKKMPKKKVSKSGMNFKKLPPLKLSRLGFDQKPVRNCLPRASKTRCQRIMTGGKGYTEKKVTITAPVQAQAVTDLVTDSHFQFEVHPTMCAEHTCCKDSWHQQESKQPVLPVCGTNGEEVEGCAILKLKIEDVYSLCLTEERADLEEVMKVKVKTKQDFDEHLDFPRPKRVKTCIA
uniref:uncharacterized protein isoform X2 n=1 Tax=Myxine glutinosa TaxID=7769 RepID=UPI00358E2EB0